MRGGHLRHLSYIIGVAVIGYLASYTSIGYRPYFRLIALASALSRCVALTVTQDSETEHSELLSIICHDRTGEKPHQRLRTRRPSKSLRLSGYTPGRPSTAPNCSF